MFYFLRCLLCGVMMIVLGACGGDSESSSTSTTVTAEEADFATFVEWSGSAWDSLVLLLEEGDKTLLFPVDCPGGGSIDEEGAEVAINDCVVTSESGTTYLGRGTYSVTEVGALTTHEWDQDLIVDDITTFSSTGSINFDTSNDLIAYDFTATFTSGVYRITGIVNNNVDSTSNLTISVEQDGESWLDCSFDDADLDALTDEEVDTACSDDDDPVCDTLECSNDFQCQLFADEDTTDEFETGNTECTAGCCALVEEESACALNTISCSSDFQCQLFADDDPADEFETDNVECGADGCCALING